MSKKKQRTVGFAFTGSFCTYEKIKEVVRQLVKEDNRVIPIFSQTAQTVKYRKLRENVEFFQFRRRNRLARKVFWIFW